MPPPKGSGVLGVWLLLEVALQTYCIRAAAFWSGAKAGNLQRVPPFGMKDNDPKDHTSVRFPVRVNVDGFPGLVDAFVADLLAYGDIDTLGLGYKRTGSTGLAIDGKIFGFLAARGYGLGHDLPPQILCFQFLGLGGRRGKSAPTH